MIEVVAKGDYRKLNSFLERALNVNNLGKLDKYGKMGVESLSENTPYYTGLAASCWDYTIERNNGDVTITWTNSDIENGCSVVLLVQYGHGTRGGTYVAGRDFINPAMKPVFDQIADSVWKEVNAL